MVGAPSTVPEVGYGLWLPRVHVCLSWGGASIPDTGRGCQGPWFQCSLVHLETLSAFNSCSSGDYAGRNLVAGS